MYVLPATCPILHHLAAKPSGLACWHSPLWQNRRSQCTPECHLQKPNAFFSVEVEGQVKGKCTQSPVGTVWNRNVVQIYQKLGGPSPKILRGAKGGNNSTNDSMGVSQLLGITCPGCSQNLRLWPQRCSTSKFTKVSHFNGYLDIFKSSCINHESIMQDLIK